MKLKLLIVVIILNVYIYPKAGVVWWKDIEPVPISFSGIHGNEAPEKYTEGEGYRAPAHAKYKVGSRPIDLIER